MKSKISISILAIFLLSVTSFLNPNLSHADGKNENDIQITTEILNVRQEPTTNSERLSQVKKGQSFKVLDQDGIWYKINTGKLTGWIHGDYVEKRNSKKKITYRNKNYSRSYQYYLLTQVNVNHQTDNYDKGWTRASLSDIDKYLNPENFIEDIQADSRDTQEIPKETYQFLLLSGYSGLSADQLNSLLEGKGILEGMGDAFIEASKRHNINEIYLLSHALLETGNGDSQLARGVKIEGKTAYNMYGIGAYDGNALVSGSNYAYDKGWFSPKKAIIDGAEFISKKYINNKNYKQDTLYKMKWNPDAPGAHQYAMDIEWATKQTGKIKELYDSLEDYNLEFEIPKYGVKE